MTGIAGAVGPRLVDPVALASRMVAAMRFHDDAREEIWTSRDAILCQVHCGGAEGQPVKSPDGERRILFWGHLQRTDTLRRRLEKGGRGPRPGATDAELVLALYDQCGSALLPDLDGSFCFAIYDATQRELLLANDRFSSYPIYWTRSPQGALVFGSYVHAVLQAPEVPRDLDERAVRELFHFRRVLGTRTLNHAVSMLAPATLLRFRHADSRGGEVRLEPWFQLDYRPERRSEGEWAEALAEACRGSIRRTMEGDERTGLLLSGGLDSRMVVAASERPVRCFHMNDSRNQEYETARRIAAAAGYEFTYLERPGDHYAALFEDAVAIGNGQYAFIGAHTIGLLPPGEVDAMLHGYAPDLHFRGTTLPHANRTAFGKTYRTTLDPRITADDVATQMVARLKYSQRGDRPQQLFAKTWAEDFEASMLASAQEMVDEARPHSADPYDWFLWPDIWYYCKFPSFLFVSSIRTFLPERSFLVDKELLDLHLRMPVGARANSRIWNRAVRRLAPRVAAVPDANTGHSPFLPEPAAAALDAGRSLGRRLGLGKRPRRAPGHGIGSWPTWHELIVHNRPLRSLIEGVLSDPEAIDPEIFDLARIEAVLDEHLSFRKNHRMFLFTLATFGGWHRKYGPPGRGLP